MQKMKMKFILKKQKKKKREIDEIKLRMQD